MSIYVTAKNSNLQHLLKNSIRMGYKENELLIDMNNIRGPIKYNAAVRINERSDYVLMNIERVLREEARREAESLRVFYRFEKRFDTFKEGIEELVKVSESAWASLRHQTGKIPETMEEALTVLAMNALHDHEDGNCYFEVSSGGVDYVTGGNVGFGWYFAGDGEFGFHDNNIGGYIFYVTHPSVVKRINEKAPESSTLRKSAEKHGWKEVEA